MDKKLYRSRTSRIIAGVCGGLGEYFDIDPVIVRTLFVMAALGGGFGLLAYIVLWIVIPEEGSGQGEGIEVQRQKGAHQDEESGRKNMGAVVLIVLGALFLFNNFMPHWAFGRLWPMLLVVAGVMILIRRQ